MNELRAADPEKWKRQDSDPLGEARKVLAIYVPQGDVKCIDLPTDMVGCE